MVKEHLEKWGFVSECFFSKAGRKIPDGITRKVRGAFDDHPYWQVSEEHARELRMALYGVLGATEKDMDKVAQRKICLPPPGNVGL